MPRAPLEPLRILLRETGALLPRAEAPLAFGLAVAAICQVGYWYLGSPGPTLLGLAPPSLPAALRNVATAVALLWLVPAVAFTWTGRDVAELGLGAGDWRFGLPAALLAGLIAAPLLWLGAADPDLQAVYPWAGAWPGRSPATFAAWAGIYAAYYASFEFFYRGYLLRLLEPSWGLRGAVWAQAVLATMVHVGKPLVETLAAFPASLLFAALAIRSRSIWWAALLHLLIGLATDAASLQRRGLLFP